MTLTRCVIFSRDRAAQLDALLQSIERFAPGLYAEKVVIYKATSDEHESAYRTLQGDWPGARLWPEQDFRDDVLDALRWPGERIAFHTDDDVWYRRPPERPPWPETFSYRLGANCLYCHPLGGVYQATPDWAAYETHLHWGWPESEHDFAYPFSLNAHTFPTNLVGNLVRELAFDRPNALEHAGHVRWLEHPLRYGTTMASPPLSCVVSIPCNRVNDGYPNPCGTNPLESPLAMLHRYQDGWRIDLAAMDFSNVVGCHQEIPIKWRRA